MDAALGSFLTCSASFDAEPKPSHETSGVALLVHMLLLLL
jgi:hypothetical protein